MRIIVRIVKRITYSIALICSYNLFVSTFGLGVAINPYSIGAVSTMGIPGLISIVVLKLLIK